MRTSFLTWIFVGVVLLSQLATALPRSGQSAAQVAQTQVDALIYPRSDVKVHAVEAIFDGGTTIGYVAHLSPQGYVALSADDDIQPIVAYSLSGVFSTQRTAQNVLLDVFCADMKLRLAAIPFTDEKLIAKNRSLWAKFDSRNPQLMRSIFEGEAYGPHLNNNWHQGSPYNRYCPVDPGTSELSVVGCVALAMGQILDYWQWPPRVSFTSANSYYSRYTTPRIFIDAPTAIMDTIIYDRSHPSYIDYMARMLFGCGVATEMSYSTEGSGTDTRKVTEQLLSRYDYSSARDFYPFGSGMYMQIRQDMRDGLICEIAIAGDEGHAVTIDGYQLGADSVYFYHLNMGWGGMDDGFYSLPSGMPEGFTIHSHSVCQILPRHVTGRPPRDLRIYPNAGLIARLLWTRPSYITEPVLRYDVYRDGVLLGSTTGLGMFDSTMTEEFKRVEYTVTAVYAGTTSDVARAEFTTGIANGWARNCGTTEFEEVFNDITIDDAGNCIGVGFVDYFGTSDMIIYKLSPAGEILIESNFGFGDQNMLSSIEPTTRSTFLVAGTFTNGDAKDITLFETDDESTLLWLANFTVPNLLDVRKAYELSDGSYAVLGRKFDGSDTISFALFATPERELDDIIEFSPSLSLYDFVVAADGNLVFAGADKSIASNVKALALATDVHGTENWRATFGDSLKQVAYSIVELADGFVIAGERQPGAMPRNTNLYFAKCSPSGEPISDRKFFAIGYGAHSLAKTSSGTIIGCGIARKFPTTNRNGMVFELTSDLDTIFTREFVKADYDSLCAVAAPIDGGMYVAGASEYSGLSATDAWMMKIGGYIPNNVLETSTSHFTPNSLQLNAFPNPFNAALEIEIAGDFSGEVGITIFDITGKVFHHEQLSCVHGSSARFVWNPVGIASGVYFVRAASKNATSTQRIMLLK